MDKQEMINEILKTYPLEENGRNGVPFEGTIVYNPTFLKFGYPYYGIADGWDWYTKTKKGFPETLKEHTFLEYATEEELTELLSLLKTQRQKA